MRVGIFGDDHLDRNLPWENSDNSRYNFRLKLKRKSIEPFDVTFHLGDLTHKKNYIDGKVIQDAIDLFSGKKVYYCLGNHDCSENLDKYKSLLHLLDKVLDGFTLVEDVETIKVDNVLYIMTSYYATEEDIKKEVVDVLERKRPDQKVLILGHWNFYNKLYKSGKMLKNFAKRIGDKVKWILGHEHNPNFFKEGAYLGCLSPNEFGQKQGKIMVVDDGEYKFWDYPAKERFLELEENDLPNEFDNPERTYLKIITNDPERTEELKEKYSDLAHCSVKYDVEKEEKEVKELCLKCKQAVMATKDDLLVCPRCGNEESKGIKDEQYYFMKVCDVFDYEIEKLAPLHKEIERRLK